MATMTKTYKYVLTFALFFCYFAYVSIVSKVFHFFLHIKYTLTNLLLFYFVFHQITLFKIKPNQGVNFYVVGPTLIELAGLFQTTIERISLIYTARSAGYTCGSLSKCLELNCSETNNT
mgnify:CR=1 FL=1